MILLIRDLYTGLRPVLPGSTRRQFVYGAFDWFFTWVDFSMTEAPIDLAAPSTRHA